MDYDYITLMLFMFYNNHDFGFKKSHIFVSLID